MADDQTSHPCVFISYSGPDREVAAALGSGLAKLGISFWWDAFLGENEPFELQIQRVLMTTKLVVALLSPRTLESEWVGWELAQASRNEILIVPLLIDDLRAEELPPPLHLLSTLTLGAGDQRMAAVAEALQKRLETLSRVPETWRSNDARRRLASAAARTAREAAEIRERITGTTGPSGVLVRGAGNPSLPNGSENRFTSSNGLAAFLDQEQMALAFTAFQTDELYFLSSSPEGRLLVGMHSFRRPTGLSFDQETLTIGSLAHIYQLKNILQPSQRMAGLYSHCFIPRVSYFTGCVDIHDVGLSPAGEVFFVASNYNCLATLSPTHSFRPIWRPAFVSALVAEDRCHLNGVALRHGVPTHATAASTSDHRNGWRDHWPFGGVVLDLRSDALACEGLSLPHSPRWLKDRLWVLNSGFGEVGWIDLPGNGVGQFRPVARCPGFTRGLSGHGRFLVVGLSRPRYGTESEERMPCFSDPSAKNWCGIQILDSDSGECVHWFRIEGAVREIFDVAVLPGVGCVRAASPLDDEAIDWITIDALTGSLS